MNAALFSFVQYRISSLIMILYYWHFIPRKYTKKMTACIITGFFLLASLTDFVFLFGKFNFNSNIIFTIIQIFIIQILAIVIGKYRDFRTLFVSISAATFVLPGNLLASFCYTETGLIGLSISIQLIIHYVVFIYLFMKLREPLIEEMKRGQGMWKAMCAFPTLIYMTIYSIAAYPSSIYQVKTNFIGVFLILILLIIAYLLVVKMLAREKENSMVIQNNEIMESHIKSLKKEVEMFQISQEKTAILRHDFRHKVVIMSSLLEAEDYSKMKQMFHEMNQEISEAKETIFSKNAVINGVLIYTNERAINRQIEFSCDLLMPQEFTVNEFEVATVLSNLLDNAMNACCEMPKGEKKFINIRGHVTKGNAIIEVSNSFSGELRYDEEEGKILSTHGKGHGFGMRSVESFAEKTGAVFDYSIENQVFYARLLFPL